MNYYPTDNNSKMPFINLSSEHKIFLGIGLATLLIIFGGVWFVSKQDERLSRPLVGQEIKVNGENHLPEGTKIEYNSNPPAAGPHYGKTQSAGIYDNPPADGYIVHSLEHGAIVLWYKKNLAKDNVENLKKIFDQMPVGKKIMTSRENLDVPVALSSWGRILKLPTIDEKQIRNFFETNQSRAPENAPI